MSLFTDETLVDFGTLDGGGPGGASSTAVPLKWEDAIELAAGNYTLTARLSNEVSEYTIPPLEVRARVTLYLMLH